MLSRMRIVSTILLTACTALFVACRSGGDAETETEPGVQAEPGEQQPEVQAEPQEQETPVGEPAQGEAQALEQQPTQNWLASLAPEGRVGINGEAVAHAGQSGTFVSIDVEGGESGATYPWHVHVGDCGSGGAVVGTDSAYPPLQIGSGGEAEAQATISERLDPDADYHVNIHLSAEQPDSIIACGALRPSQTAPQ